MDVVLLLALDFVSWFSLPSIQQSLCSCFGEGKELERHKIYFSAKISVREGVVELKRSFLRGKEKSTFYIKTVCSTLEAPVASSCSLNVLTHVECK